jgi:hypothetical protein
MIFLYVNIKMSPVDTTPGMGGGGIKGNDRVDEFN